MKAVLIFFIICFLSFGSCKKSNPLPMDPQSMIPVLVDIHLAEAATAQLPANIKDTLLAKHYKQIYQIHQVDSARFDSALQIIKANPKWLGQVYERVMNEIDRQKTELMK